MLCEHMKTVGDELNRHETLMILLMKKEFKPKKKMSPFKIPQESRAQSLVSPWALICRGCCSAVIDWSASCHFFFSTVEHPGWTPPYCDVTVGLCLWSVSHRLLYIKNEDFPGVFHIATELTDSETSVVNEMGRKREETRSQDKKLSSFIHMQQAWMP